MPDRSPADSAARAARAARGEQHRWSPPSPVEMAEKISKMTSCPERRRRLEALDCRCAAVYWPMTWGCRTVSRIAFELGPTTDLMRRKVVKFMAQLIEAGLVKRNYTNGHVTYQRVRFDEDNHGG